MINEFNIGKITVGNNCSPYYIADIGANHDGNLDRAYKLIEQAKEAGAHAAKFQNFVASKIVSQFGFENLGNLLSHQSKWKKPVYEIYEDASIPIAWTEKLKQKCVEMDIEYFTSPYDFNSVNDVDPYLEIYKIGSGDITWLELIEFIALKGKPVLLATGASDMNDVDRAMNVLQRNADKVCLMQCNTNYTLDKEKYKYVNLQVLNTFRRKYPDVLLGLSDHTLGHATVVASIALGARIIEKHFTDDNSREGPDHKFSMNVKTWKDMVENANQAFDALGDGIKRIEENEKQSVVVQRRSIRATEDFMEGMTLKEGNLEVLRPITEDGLEPYKLQGILGKKLLKPVKKGEHITSAHLNTAL